MWWRRLAVGLLALAPLAARPYAVGLDPGWPAQLDAAARRAQVLAAGCRMPRVTVRAACLAAPGGAGCVDADVSAYRGAGASPLLVIEPGPPRVALLPDGREAHTWEPAGLALPIFASASDEPREGDHINAQNTWAQVVFDLVERYDGDGTADAPGSPRVRWFCFTDEPDRDATSADEPLPEWPGAGYDRLARLLAVGHAAARLANPDCSVGVLLAQPATLAAVLADERHPAGEQLDFVGFRASGTDSSDGLCFLGDGLAPRARAFRAALNARGAWLDLLCCGIGLPGDGPRQRAAVPKTQVVAVALGLVTAQWSALGDSRTDGPGLLAGDGAGPAKDGWFALVTLTRLLGDALAERRARYSGEESVGPDARAYRFNVNGRDLLVAWAYDAGGPTDRRVHVRLPLHAGARYARCEWDFCRTGRPAAMLDVRREAPLVELGLDPVYFFAGEPAPSCSPVTAPAAPAAPPWQVSASSEEPRWPAAAGFDGDSDRPWRGGGGQARAWWRIDFSDGPVTADQVQVKVGRLPGATWQVEVSDDGATWRAVSAPTGCASWAPQTVRLNGRQAAARWRLVFWKQPLQTVALYEMVIGGRAARQNRVTDGG